MEGREKKKNRTRRVYPRSATSYPRLVLFGLSVNVEIGIFSGTDCLEYRFEVLQRTLCLGQHPSTFARAHTQPDGSRYTLRWIRGRITFIFAKCVNHGYRGPELGQIHPRESRWKKKKMKKIFIEWETCTLYFVRCVFGTYAVGGLRGSVHFCVDCFDFRP